jgi:hypothetical protein
MAAMMDEMEEGQELPMVKIGDASVAGTSIEAVIHPSFQYHLLDVPL